MPRSSIKPTSNNAPKRRAVKRRSSKPVTASQPSSAKITANGSAKKNKPSPVRDYSELTHLSETNRRCLRELDEFVAANQPLTKLGEAAVALRRAALLEGEPQLNGEEFWDYIEAMRG